MKYSGNVDMQYDSASWCIVENNLNFDTLGKNASLFTLGNGTLGFRGDFEEGLSCHDCVEGTYLNGFYEKSVIKYGENAYGYAEFDQTMLNISNGKRIRIWLDDEEFTLDKGEVLSYRRCLDMHQGFLERVVTWRSPRGKTIRIRFYRFVSLADSRLAAVCCDIEPLVTFKTLTIRSEIDADVANLSKADDPRVGSSLARESLITIEKSADDDLLYLSQKTATSQLTYTCAAINRIINGRPCSKHSWADEKCVYNEFIFDGDECGKSSIRIEKYLAYEWGELANAKNILDNTIKAALLFAERGISKEFKKHKACLADFWKRSNVFLEGDDSLLQGLRFSLFQLFNSVGRDGKTNISAKGLTGEGYEGHYFWDTETYILPVFIYTYPEIARQLLCYRYKILDHARKRARQLGHTTGALYAWRTIGGDECSAYYPAGTAQYHINADIAHAVLLYCKVTGDKIFMWDYGIEILVETARLWVDLGFYNPQKNGKFCINGVTGPDEYNVLVNNNCYTNMMAVENLEQASSWLEQMSIEEPQKRIDLDKRLKISQGESVEWKKAAKEMFIPQDDNTGIYLQDDEFANRVPWPISDIPSDHFPLLLHYHPLVIYRHKVCKQADLILGMLLLSERFTLTEKKANFEYYNALTTHDSSLSKAVFSILATEIGYDQIAYEYFKSTVRLDLDDIHNNSKDGLHMANMGGAWMCMVYGFAGMRVTDVGLSFSPRLPQGWKSFGFRITYNGRIINLHVTEQELVLNLIEGEFIEITCYEQSYRLTDSLKIKPANL